MLSYVEILEVTDKFAMIWNYIEILKVCKFVLSLFIFGYICNYILDDGDKTIWSSRKQ